jgi:asparagine synthase (glutamine-hydrolysing)
MCGISGILSFDKDLSVINKMTAALLKRGPDGSGVLYSDISGEGANCSFFSPNELPNLQSKNNDMVLALGHTRLSIIDVNQRSSQPMQSSDERYWIVYNGEIFNYIELKKQLTDAGYKFKTESDTEVVMHAYDFWGVDCLNKFNGMWAFCIYDIFAQKLFLSRDRFGEKPFYYAKCNDFFIFGSEIKSIFESGLVDTAVCQSETNRFINNGPIEFTESTFFQNILRLPPGHFLMVDMIPCLGEIIPQRYYSLKVNKSNESYDEKKAQEYAKQYYELLKDSVRLRIRADVPIGSALSGGMDSSSIVYLINELNRENRLDLTQKTYSCVYKNNIDTAYCDESGFIELVASTLGVENYQITPVTDEIPNEHALMIESFECPPENTCMSGWWTYKLVQRGGTKVTLDGQGADEQLTGYLYYYAYFLYSLSPKDFLREVRYCWKVPGAFPYVWRGASAFLLKFLLGTNAAAYIVKKILGRSLPQNLNEVLHNDFKTGLVNLFNNADRSSMAHSVESRMPFVDHRLVEFLADVPACYKIHKGWSKYLARKAFAGKLPDQICWRDDKMGWPIPEDVWFKGLLGSWLDEECESIQELVSKNVCDPYNIENKKYKLRALNLSIVKKCFGFKVVEQKLNNTSKVKIT